MRKKACGLFLYKYYMIDYEVDAVGLGITITMLSLFLSTDQEIILRAPIRYRLLRDLKKIFSINRLTIIDQELVPNCIVGHNMSKQLVSDYCKFWSPYFSVNSVNLFGQQHAIGTYKKPCIGLATDHLWDNELPNNSIPFNRLYPKKIWLQIIDLIMASGYDVITLNQKEVNFEERVYKINEFCDCVIGYEGGACHLAHLLKVPCIIMPWHHHENGADPHPDGSLFYVPQKMHIDFRTYFLKSVDEILSWDSATLKETIKKLYSEQGNNVFINNKLHVNTRHLLVNTGTSANQAHLTEWETNFVKTYISNPTVGGF